jgi:hypothetical protein
LREGRVREGADSAAGIVDSGQEECQLTYGVSLKRTFAILFLVDFRLL